VTKPVLLALDPPPTASLVLPTPSPPQPFLKQVEPAHFVTTPALLALDQPPTASLVLPPQPPLQPFLQQVEPAQPVPPHAQLAAVPLQTVLCVLLTSCSLLVLQVHVWLPHVMPHVPLVGIAKTLTPCALNVMLASKEMFILVLETLKFATHILVMHPVPAA